MASIRAAINLNRNLLARPADRGDRGSMSQYRFEKIQVPAELSLSRGTPVAGSFFVAGSAFDHDGPERVGDVLNGRTGLFLPFMRTDGSTALYNRSHIVIVRLGPGARELEDDPGF